MKKIHDYLSDEQHTDLEGMSDQEKVATVLQYIKSVEPTAKFRCSELAEFLGKDPRHPRGMYPMVEAIKRKDPTFPFEMIETGKGKQKFDSKKVGDLSSRWKTLPKVEGLKIGKPVSSLKAGPEDKD
jgi:hypothetical protein